MNNSLKRTVYVAVPIILTLILIFAFKDKNFNDILNKQKLNLASLYTKNLYALLGKVGLTNDDIFKFAFTGKIPLSSSRNKFLQLSSEENNSYAFEISEGKDFQISNQNDLEQFAKSLNLNSHQRKSIDSLLVSYKDKLEKQILIGSKNSMAVNSNLWNLHKLIMADVASFATKQNLTPPVTLTEAEIQNIVKEAKNFPDTNYIIISPDTMFVHSIKKSSIRFKGEISEMEKNIAALEKKIKTEINKGNFHKKYSQQYKVYADTNWVKIQIPQIAIPDLKDLDSLEIKLQKLDNVLEKISEERFWYNYISPNVKVKPKKKYIAVLPGNALKIPNIDSVIVKSFAPIDTMKILRNLNFDFNSNKYDKVFQDSMAINGLLTAKKTLENLQKQFKNNENMRKELQNEISKLNEEIAKIKKKK